VVTAPLRPAPPIAEAKPGTGAPVATPPPVASASPPVARNTENLKTSPKAIKEPYSAHAARELAKADTPTAPPAQVALAPTSPPPVAAAPAAKADAPAPAAKSEAAPASPPVTTPPATVANEEDGIEWVWPAKGRIVTGFSDTANLKGIDIAGTAGQPIVASAPGKVVYAGSGLRGYGKLVIIKHNNTYLSAYAHNRDILVKEGQQVGRGQKIAEMGDTDSEQGQVKLHFEIRRLGKPMDPTRYLPPA
jgi:lipoprotein NlpD